MQFQCTAVFFVDPREKLICYSSTQTRCKYAQKWYNNTFKSISLIIISNQSNSYDIQVQHILKAFAIAINIRTGGSWNPLCPYLHPCYQYKKIAFTLCMSSKLFCLIVLITFIVVNVVFDRFVPNALTYNNPILRQ